jgi:phage gp16-like protein
MKPEVNRALQRLIFAACRQMGIDDEARHDLQVSVTGKSSLRDMTEAELHLVAHRLKDSGFKHGSTGREAHPAAPRGDLRYVHVLWGLLGRAGKLTSPGRAGLNAFVRSRFEGTWQSVPIDIDALRDARQISDVTRALKDWCRREGIATERKGTGRKTGETAR